MTTKDCPNCQGTGYVTEEVPMRRVLRGQQSWCLNCLGTGKTPADEN
ncbi:hypothetical protein [Nocardiopsis sp. YSL2]|nr:hypothetical protein [Nocardiopsis sp. YSL2]